MIWYSKEVQDLVRKIFPKHEPEKSVFEQQKEIVDAAEEFDRLTAYPAWTKALRFMAREINSTLVEATKHELDPAKMMWSVARWNAKRQMLDNLQAHIEATQAERDRIIAEIKEIQDGGYTGN